MTRTKNYLLGYNDMYIYQDNEMFNFSLDSVLLPNFVTINKKDKKILDIGCGNAPIPLILSTRTNAHIDGVEIQKEVYDLAIESVKENKLEKQINILNQDINDYYMECESDTYDVITCNPPYFKYNDNSNVNESCYKTYARHEINLDIERLFKISKKLLKNNGIIAIVQRPERLIDIIVAMKKNNIEPKRIQFVYPKKDKDANILLIEGSKNGKSGIKIMNPLYSHLDNGEYTEEIKQFFEKR
ncbi:MAG TPA: tRNA1(Val) (adenine(37)-N6)-methyltransferase [Bacilli bacterium]|nr:tRNA1(Val) (adenine(37)-N6)-methyltransferase [Bacilli bacterium]